MHMSEEIKRDQTAEEVVAAIEQYIRDGRIVGSMLKAKAANGQNSMLYQVQQGGLDVLSDIAAIIRGERLQSLEEMREIYKKEKEEQVSYAQ
jgi:hypothetical protein